MYIFTYKKYRVLILATIYVKGATNSTNGKSCGFITQCVLVVILRSVTPNTVFFYKKEIKLSKPTIQNKKCYFLEVHEVDILF